MSGAVTSHYELLCVDEAASFDEIKTAYRRLIRNYHPDVVGLSGEAMTKRINDAFTELKDQGTRAEYDRELRTSRRPQPDTAPAWEPHASYRQPQQGHPSYSEQLIEEPVDTSGYFIYDPALHRRWRKLFFTALSFTVALAVSLHVPAVAAFFISDGITAPTPFMQLSQFATFVAASALISSKPHPKKRCIFLGSVSLAGPLALLGMWPLTLLKAEVDPVVLVTTILLFPAVVVTRVVWAQYRQFIRARRSLKQRGEL